MRLQFILRFFGRFHLLLSALFLVPMFVGFAFPVKMVWPYLIPSSILVTIGALMTWSTRRWQSPQDIGLRRREGFLFVSGSWILIVLYGALPFLLSGKFPDLASAIFESSSGFTTTGATVLSGAEIDALPKSLLFWRSFSHWLGGMGIIVLSVAILPELAVGGMQLFSAESSGLGVDRLAPRIAQTAKKLWVLYVSLTALELVMLLLGDMSFFDALNHAFATTATGGFSTRGDSVGAFQSVYIDTVITVFMFLAGINFAMQYRALRGEWGKFFKSSELRLYIAILVSVTALICIDLLMAGYFETFQETIRYSGFQVVSILTTTGFGTWDFDSWPTFSKTLIVILMTVGGCAGSTAGGLKIIRLVVVLKHALRECQRLLYPKMVKPVIVDGKAVDEEILFSILGFFLLYMMVFLCTVLLLAALPHGPLPEQAGVAISPPATGATVAGSQTAEAGTEPPGPQYSSSAMDLTTATTAALSALNSIGPGLGNVGPTRNFGFVHWFGKLALSFCMILGRLEIYTLLILFLPRFWLRH